MLISLFRSSITDPIIRSVFFLQLASAVLSIAAMTVDKRQLLGLNVWVKPLKFNVSIIVALVTAGLILAGLDGCDVGKLWAGNSLALALGIEGVLICIQAARGVRSHMNVSTPFDAQVSMWMGLMAVVATLAMAAILALTFMAAPRWPPAVKWGIRLGLAMFLAGSAEGTIMFRHGGHTMGAADGGPGLPGLNWSRHHGDFRIAHFFALHALQVFPAFGLVSNRAPWSATAQVALVTLLSALYTAGVWYLFKLALHGRPLALPA